MSQQKRGFFSRISSIFSPQEIPKRTEPPIVHEEDTIKIAVIGGSKVGKSSVVRRFIHSCYTRQYEPTVGFDTFSQAYEHPTIETDHHYRLVFWDVAAPELYGKHHANIFYKVHGIIMVFDCTDVSSVDVIDQWRLILSTEQFSSLANVPVVLFANKVDKGNLVLSRHDLDTYSKKCNFKFWAFTSAAEEGTVESSVHRLLALILSAKQEKISEDDAVMITTESDAVPVTKRIHIKGGRRPQPSDIFTNSDYSQSQDGDSAQFSESSSVEAMYESSSPIERKMTEKEKARFSEVKIVIDDFYGKLEKDLDEIKAQVQEHRKHDISLLERQRIAEYNTLMYTMNAYKLVPEIKWENQEKMSLDWIHSAVVSNKKKWAKLLENLDVEVLLLKLNTDHRSSNGDASLGQHHDSRFLKENILKKSGEDAPLYHLNSYDVSQRAQKPRGDVFLSKPTQKDMHSTGPGISQKRRNPFTRQRKVANGNGSKARAGARTMGFGFRKIGQQKPEVSPFSLVQEDTATTGE